MLTMETPPMPLEWHPAYWHQTWLVDWLDGTGEHAQYDRVLVPYSKRPSLGRLVDEEFPGAPPQAHMLTKWRCWGLAPYVGRPFVYAWWVATDELGRGIAADSTIQYQDPDPRSAPLI